MGMAMIQFHFQYYWYAIIFLVFDVSFMFLTLGGIVVSSATESTDAARTLGGDVPAMLLALSGFLLIMVMGVWHVFRKRGRIYI